MIGPVASEEKMLTEYMYRKQTTHDANSSDLKNHFPLTLNIKSLKSFIKQTMKLVY